MSYIHFTITVNKPFEKLSETNAGRHIRVLRPAFAYGTHFYLFREQIAFSCNYLLIFGITCAIIYWNTFAWLRGAYYGC